MSTATIGRERRASGCGAILHPSMWRSDAFELTDFANVARNKPSVWAIGRAPASLIAVVVSAERLPHGFQLVRSGSQQSVENSSKGPRITNEAAPPGDLPRP
jgi:hypothetical protein